MVAAQCAVCVPLTAQVPTQDGEPELFLYREDDIVAKILDA